MVRRASSRASLAWAASTVCLCAACTVAWAAEALSVEQLYQRLRLLAPSQATGAMARLKARVVKVLKARPGAQRKKAGLRTFRAAQRRQVKDVTQLLSKLFAFAILFSLNLMTILLLEVEHDASDREKLCCTIRGRRQFGWPTVCGRRTKWFGRCMCLHAPWGTCHRAIAITVLVYSMMRIVCWPSRDGRFVLGVRLGALQVTRDSTTQRHKQSGGQTCEWCGLRLSLHTLSQRSRGSSYRADMCVSPAPCKGPRCVPAPHRNPVRSRSKRGSTLQD